MLGLGMPSINKESRPVLKIMLLGYPLYTSPKLPTMNSEQNDQGSIGTRPLPSSPSSMDFSI